ncbi:rRNA biogenesis protein rrp5 [Tilletia horrida]|uniref:rRNA biogenesis protein rrp5 n=1 Tax=Tilletia horrida TaxID=155126 RepID=A0AAN6JPA9_9BASI|nr:rRNA biogenesis protein rrp5 [Tilletia horrida]KAK0545455.1 rRNA biogenesis protein rrp5 [Tilletia horrida]KAK0561458.1 rRNA biogenesis protein rrp5 [Tilletia horrida]
MKKPDKKAQSKSGSSAPAYAPAAPAKKRKSFDTGTTAASSSSASKKPKTSSNGDSSSEHKKRRPSGSAEAPPPASILLSSQAQTDFPRGGGSALTPLEHRQALREARAEADALFKDSFSSSKSAKVTTADGTFDPARNKAGLAKQKYNRDKKNALKKKHALPGDSAPKDDAAAKKGLLRIEHLSYKRLQPGARLLCTILAVHPFALVLSLPGQLLGHVPITAISPTFTDRLQAMADGEADSDQEDSDEDEASDSDESDDESEPRQKRNGTHAGRSGSVPELRDIFSVGQWVHATVTNVLSPSALKASFQNEGGPAQRSREGGEYERESRRVELSMDPALYNQGVSAEELGEGYVLPAAVRSIEDHGYLLDLGFDSKVSAFCTFANQPGGKKGPRLHLGQVLPAALLSVADDKRSITVTLQPQQVSAAFLGSKSTPPSISGLLPGLAVDALITANLPSGLNVKLFGLFNATIDRAHLPSTKPGQSYETYFKEGKKIRARVFWELGDLFSQQVALGEREDDDDAVSGSARKVALSAADHVLGLQPPNISLVSGIDPDTPAKPLSEAFPIGTKMKVTVLRIDSDWGLYCSFAWTESQKSLMGPAASSLQGFVHISSVSDDHIDTLSTSDSAPYKVGSLHEARVVSHSPTDRLLLLSLKKSVLALKFMRVSELEVGELMQGTIKDANENRIVVDLGGLQNGVILPTHYSDIVLKSKKVLAKYKPGLSVLVRIWAVNPARSQITLTLKKSLLQSELPVVASLQDARVGVITHAVVSRLPDPKSSRGLGGGLLIDLYGGLRAFVPTSETMEPTPQGGPPIAEDLHTSFFVGKVVKVRLTSVDYETGRIMASIRQALPAFQERLNVSEYQMGQQVKGTITAVHEDVVVLNVEPTQARGLVSLAVLARMRQKDVETLRGELSEGQKIEGLQVWSKSEEKGLLHLNDARTALNSSARGSGKVANGRFGDAVESAISSLVLLNKAYPVKVGVHGYRGDLNSVQVTIPNVDNGAHDKTTILARLHVTDCYDSYDDAADTSAACVQSAQRGEGSRAATNLPAEGASLQCVVAQVQQVQGRPTVVHMSARPSVLNPASAVLVRDPVIHSVDDLHVGSKYRAFVKMISEGGLMVELGRNVVARVKVRNTVDVLSAKWRDNFEIGKVVEGTILSITKQSKHKTVVDMSLRSSKEDRKKQQKEAGKKSASDANGDKKKKMLPMQHGLDQLAKNQKVKCVVKSIKDDLGIFLQVQDPNINVSGLCHKSEVSMMIKVLSGLSSGLCAESVLFCIKVADNGSPEALKAYNVGDRVKAIVLKVNQADKKISFGLKPSYFQDSDFVDSDEDDDADVLMPDALQFGCDEDDDDEEEEEDEEGDEDDEEDEDDDAEEDDLDEDEQDVDLSQGADGLDDSDSDEDDEMLEAADLEDSVLHAGGAGSSARPSKAVEPLQLAGGFSWSAGLDDGAEDESDVDSDSSSEADETELPRQAKGSNGKGKAPEKKAPVNLDEKLPESVSDFERVLLSSPNNSFLWIQFMTFQLQLSDVDGARQVAQRAFKVINHREEEEKLNVWIALLNLEDRYGDEETLDATFQEAVQANDAETVYLKFLTILEKGNKLEKAEAIWKRACKKFNGSMKIWTSCARFYLRHNRADDVRALLSRAQQSLPKSRHVELVKSFALAEFAVGEPERGRTLFEKLVDSHPKKLDLWWLYTDQETKAGNVPAARSIYERVLALPLSVKQGKAVLKKWHAFEQKYGTPADAQRVMKKAQSFVEAAVRKRAGEAAVPAGADEDDEAEDDDDLIDDDDESDGDE